MSRKKIKKELVRRNISMYDPMGIYGRGLTKNQKEGMTHRMKVEYMSPPPVRINQQLLEEYKKNLIHYGISTCFHERLVQCTFTCNAGTDVQLQFTSDEFKVALDSTNIKYMGYFVDSFVVRRATNNTFPSVFKYGFAFFDKFWEQSTMSPGSAMTQNSKNCTISSPIKIADNYIGMDYITYDPANDDWYPVVGYLPIDNETSVIRDQVKVGESMPFAMYPEKGYTTAGNYGRGLAISYTSDASFDIIFNFRVIY